MMKRQLPAAALIALTLLLPAVASAAHVMIGPADLHPTSNEVHDYSIGDGWFRNDGDYVQGNDYVAPLHLPDRAIIQRAVILYYDNGADSIHFTLRRLHFARGTFSDVFNFLTDGQVAEYRSKILRLPELNFREIDNLRYNYEIIVRFTGAGANYLFRAIRIDYTVP